MQHPHQITHKHFLHAVCTGEHCIIYAAECVNAVQVAFFTNTNGLSNALSASRPQQNAVVSNMFDLGDARVSG